MSENGSSTRPGKRGTKQFLSPSQKYEIWLQLVRQEATIAEAAATEHVDRSTIMRIRTVAKEGALAALAAPKPGVGAKARDYELEQANAEVAQLSEACKELAVKLTLIEGKEAGAEWLCPTSLWLQLICADIVCTNPSRPFQASAKAVPKPGCWTTDSGQAVANPRTQNKLLREKSSSLGKRHAGQRPTDR